MPRKTRREPSTETIEVIPEHGGWVIIRTLGTGMNAVRWTLSGTGGWHWSNYPNPSWGNGKFQTEKEARAWLDTNPLPETLRSAKEARKTRREPEHDAHAAGADYAREQLAGSYFQDWVWEQMAEAERMRQADPNSVIDASTPAGARKVAKNMLQQLKWDTKRALKESKEFFEGFDEVLQSQSSIDWLADMILDFDKEAREKTAPEAREARTETMTPEQRDTIVAALHHYGGGLSSDGFITHGEKVLSVRPEVKKGRLRMVAPDGNVLATYPVSKLASGVADFVERFWYWKPVGAETREAILDFDKEARKGSVSETRRGRAAPPTVPGAGTGLEWHRYRDSFVGVVDGVNHFILDPTAHGDWILWAVNPKTGVQTHKIGRYPTAADAKDAARAGQKPREAREAGGRCQLAWSRTTQASTATGAKGLFKVESKPDGWYVTLDSGKLGVYAERKGAERAAERFEADESIPARREAAEAPAGKEAREARRGSRGKKTFEAYALEVEQALVASGVRPGQAAVWTSNHGAFIDKELKDGASANDTAERILESERESSIPYGRESRRPVAPYYSRR